MAERLQGIFTPHMVPLDDYGRIDEDELRRYVDWLIDRGVHGLYPNGSTGEFTRFTPEERRLIIRVVCDQAAGRVPVLAGAAEANVRETLDACAAYAEFGARAVAVVSPFYYKLSPESVYAYFAALARDVPIDLTLYNIPMFASPIDVPTIARLAAEFPRVIGIKDSSGDLAFMMRMIAAVRPERPDFTFLTGWDAVLVPMLIMGVDGGTHATSGVVPELTRQLYDLTRAGQLDDAVALQYRLLELFDAMIYSADFPEGFRAATELRGIRLGPSRQPLSDRQQVDRDALSEKLQCILSDFGAVDPPAAGCASRIAGGPLPVEFGRGDFSREHESETDHVARVTAGVLEELRQRGVL